MVQFFELEMNLHDIKDMFHSIELTINNAPQYEKFRKVVGVESIANMLSLIRGKFDIEHKTDSRN